MFYTRKATLRLDRKYIVNKLYVSDVIINDLKFYLSKVDISNIDKILFIFSSIYYISVTNKKVCSRKHYIPLNSRYLQKIVGGRHSKKIMDFLIEKDFIECDFHSEIGVRSRGYRLGKKYRDCQFYQRETNMLNLSCFKSRLRCENHKYLEDLLQDLDVDVELASEAVDNSAKSEHSKESGHHYINAIKNKEHYLTVDDKTGRVFTPAVNASKVIRPFLTYKGKNLVEMDIKNSQPLLLNSLYTEESQESKKFKFCTEVLDFYDVVNEKAYNNNGNRDAIKVLLYKFLFGWHVYDEIRPIYTFFKTEFPILLKKIYLTKEENYKCLPLLLQKKEADAMIGVVVTFARKNNIPVFPIHDSFMVLPEHAEIIEKETKSAFQQLYGVTPTIKKKDYSLAPKASTFCPLSIEQTYRPRILPALDHRSNLCLN